MLTTELYVALSCQQHADDRTTHVVLHMPAVRAAQRERCAVCGGNKTLEGTRSELGRLDSPAPRYSQYGTGPEVLAGKEAQASTGDGVTSTQTLGLNVLIIATWDCTSSTASAAGDGGVRRPDCHEAELVGKGSAAGGLHDGAWYRTRFET